MTAVPRWHLRFEVADGNVVEQRWDGSPIRVGRDDDCPIRIDHPSISRRHARFQIDDGCLRIDDLGSANGTWSGDTRLAPGSRLQIPAKVRLADVCVVFVTPRKTAPSARLSRTIVWFAILMIFGMLISMPTQHKQPAFATLPALQEEHLPPTPAQRLVLARQLIAEGDRAPGQLLLAIRVLDTLYQSSQAPWSVSAATDRIALEQTLLSRMDQTQRDARITAARGDRQQGEVLEERLQILKQAFHHLRHLSPAEGPRP